MTPPDAQAIPASRLHALSDGVFAFAMTLLVLDLRVPELVAQLSQVSRNAALGHDLAALSGKLAIYAMTFLVTGLSWLSHTRLFAWCASEIRVWDQRLGFLNVLYLMTVALLPFTAALLGTHGDLAWGVAPYALNMMLISASFGLMLRRVQGREVGSVAPLRAFQRRALTNLAVFTLMLLLALVSPPLAWFTPLLLLAQPLLGRHD